MSVLVNGPVNLAKHISSSVKSGVTVAAGGLKRNTIRVYETVGTGVKCIFSGIKNTAVQVGGTFEDFQKRLDPLEKTTKFVGSLFEHLKQTGYTFQNRTSCERLAQACKPVGMLGDLINLPATVSSVLRGNKSDVNGSTPVEIKTNLLAIHAFTFAKSLQTLGVISFTTVSKYAKKIPAIGAQVAKITYNALFQPLAIAISAQSIFGLHLAKDSKNDGHLSKVRANRAALNKLNARRNKWIKIQNVTDLQTARAAQVVAKKDAAPTANKIQLDTFINTEIEKEETAGTSIELNSFKDKKLAYLNSRIQKERADLANNSTALTTDLLKLGQSTVTLALEVAAISGLVVAVSPVALSALALGAATMSMVKPLLKNRLEVVVPKTSVLNPVAA